MKLVTIGSSSARVLVDIDFKSRSGQMKTSDASKRVPADYIPTLEDQLKSAEETLINIGKEIDFARRQEVMLRQAGGKISRSLKSDILLNFIFTFLNRKNSISNSVV
jgi:hypothetical protein